MSSTEMRFCRGSGETVDSFHASRYPSPSTEDPACLLPRRAPTPSYASTEDLGDLHDSLEEVDVVELDPHDQPARMVAGNEVVDSDDDDDDDDDDNCNVQVVYEDKSPNTKIICPAASTLGYRTPQQMLQFFSMRLSSSGLSYPISVYGILAVCDDLDQRRNYLFNCPRDTAVEIVNQPVSRNICTGRGTTDLWVKKEGNGSADKHILSAYAEIEVRANFDIMLGGRIPGVDCNLDLTYMIIARSIEAVVQVYAEVDHPHHVKFTALSTGYDDEIVLFDDKISGSVKLFQHIVAVKRNENLDVLLRVDESLFQWTFHDEYVGPVSSPDDSILQYGQFFVRVLFAPKNSA
ncbi:hypothetical protein TRIUR3_30629 [Triticum urartu]|uniref:DUF6598 domain-containing protein n=1 Tax=Triticum urartu TaxID=4572 RepID=M7Z0B7_TRIUA|nr:hypothetical protein TRIUR3_30629 [Triticum urartu]